MARGRPRGAVSWWRNPDNIAAHYAKSLMEMWLAGAPVETIKVLLRPIVDQTQFASLIDTCWSRPPMERRYTVPKRVTRDLCKVAIAHVEALHLAQEETLSTDYFRVLKSGIEANIKDSGLTEARINAASRRADAAHKDWRRPNLEKVIEIVGRRTPNVTLRRKARARRRAN